MSDAPLSPIETPRHHHLVKLESALAVYLAFPARVSGCLMDVIAVAFVQAPYNTLVHACVCEYVC